MGTNEPDASKLRRGPREVWRSRPRAGEECMPGRAESLSELVRFEVEDSESNATVHKVGRSSDKKQAASATYGQELERFVSSERWKGMGYHWVRSRPADSRSQG